MINNRKKTFLVIGIFVLLIILGSTSYAFFAYSREGSANTISVGRVSFNHTQSTLVSLSNAYPIDVSNGIPNDNTKVGTFTINVAGDSDNDGGIEYLISSEAFHAETSNGKKVPISLNITVNNLGTESNSYFDARENTNASIYKKLTDTITGDQKIFVGFIVKNPTVGTATGVNGSITVKAYLDAAKIEVVNDENNNPTPGKEIFTFTEWNSLQTNGLSFKIRVEAKEGIWVEDTSFYGVLSRNADTTTQINFAYESSSTNGQGLYILPWTENNTYPIYYYRGAVDNNNVVFGGFCWQIVRTTDTGGIKMIYNGAVTGTSEEPTCENTTHASRIISSSKFNSSTNSVSDVGYMSNARYTHTNAAGAEGSIYGKNVEWDGTNYLVYEDDNTQGSTNTTKDANHHYSCGTAGTTSCSNVRYYYYNNYYITLTSGELVEDAIYKMTGNVVNPDVDVVTRNQGYVLNQNNSTAKTGIENWFKTNLTNEVDNAKRNYQTYLEDTVYCNDRSFKTIGGWKSNGGSLSAYLYFGTLNRFQNSWYSTTNVPTTACPREIDSFSVGNSIAHLNYPVGLLTADEIVMAGARGNGGQVDNSTYYLYTGNDYLSMSPEGYEYRSAYVATKAYGFYVNSYGGVGYYDLYDSYGIRPVISLKPGTEFETGGDGTGTNPYVVKYE